MPGSVKIWRDLLPRITRAIHGQAGSEHDERGIAPVQSFHFLSAPVGNTLSPEGRTAIEVLDWTTQLKGRLHLFVAFDWGEEVDLERARELVPDEFQGLSRRPRTPPSFDYRPPPLGCRLDPVTLELPELGNVEVRGEATIFDFGGVSVAFHVPFETSASALARIAGKLADPEPLLRGARTAVAALNERALPAIQNPHWQPELCEDYLVFEFAPAAHLNPAVLLENNAAWLAGLLGLEAGVLSPEEVNEAVRLRCSYTPSDLFLADWAAAVLIDSDCLETLQIIEFANLQLLEYRYLDGRLDDVLATAYRLINYYTRAHVPLWRSHARPLRHLGQLKVDASEIFERTGNALKLIGDQYLARAYRQLAARFHLQEWEQAVRRKLEAAEGVYKVLSDQVNVARTELLEATIVLLIVLEIVLALFFKK